MRTHFRLLRLRRPALLYGYNVQLDVYRHSSQGEAGSAIVNIVTCNIDMDHLIYQYQNWLFLRFTVSRYSTYLVHVFGTD